MLASLLCAASAALFAKDSNVDTRYLRDHAQTRGFMLGRPVRPQPTPDGKSVLFLRSGPRAAKLALFEFDVASKKTRELLTPEQLLKGAEENLSPEEKARRERQRVSVGGFTTYQLSDDGSTILLSLSGKLYLVDRATTRSRELPLAPGTVLDPKFSPDSKKISFVRDHDLFVFDLDKNEEIRITKGGTAAVSFGSAEFVAQEEMARFTGYWWSPTSDRIAYQATDNRDVEVWHVADPINPALSPTPFFYPRPGKNNAKVRLLIAPLAGASDAGEAHKEVVWDQANHPYLATVRWSKYGPLSIVVQNREQTEAVLLEVDHHTGKTTTLLTEKDSVWVNLHQEAPRWLPKGNFLWIGEQRLGGPTLELRARNGRLSRVLATPESDFQSLVSVSPDGEEIIYSASNDTTESHLYRLHLDGDKEPEKLTLEKGLHAGVFNKDHKIWVRTSRLMEAMPITTVHQGDGKYLGELPSVAEEPPFTPHVDLVRVGPKNLYAAVVFPRNFEPRKRYPVMVDVYGGPHHLHVAASRNRWLLDQWYADQGFIVVAIDGRGTPGRGRDWERVIARKFGSVPLDDQVEGLKALGERYPAMDLGRVGIDGWSFGGYMSALAVMRRPDVFHAGVAGAPVCDWLDYDTHYTERYLGVPQKDDPAYHEGSLLTYAKDLQKPLMILHGTADDNVYFRHALKLVDALFRQNKEFEMVPLSGLTHMVPDPVVMEALHGRIARFFKKHLGDPR